jgi:hypothetical protein
VPPVFLWVRALDVVFQFLLPRLSRKIVIVKIPSGIGLFVIPVLATPGIFLAFGAHIPTKQDKELIQYVSRLSAVNRFIRDLYTIFPGRIEKIAEP